MLTPLGRGGLRRGKFNMAGDPNYNSVALLLHMDGANGSTIFTDSSPTPKTVTAFANAQISTAQSKFGGASALFDGVGDYLLLPASTDWDFGTGDFTIELQYFQVSTPGSSIWQRLLQLRDGDFISGVSLVAGTGSNGNLGVNVSTNGTSWNIMSDVDLGPATNATWLHIAVVRSGGIVLVFVGGVQKASAPISGALAFGASWNPNIGGQSGINRTINGHIDEVRITKGVARYTANFTPPTAPFPNAAAQFTGNITESLAITDWTVQAHRIPDGALTGSVGVAGATYTLNVTSLDPQALTLAPKIDGVWKANTAIALGYYVVAVNPEPTPHLWKCTTAGTTGATEPVWNLSGTTIDGTATWTYIAPLVNPVTLGPKIPA